MTTAASPWRYEALKALVAGERLPVMLVDLDALDRNARRLAAVAAGGDRDLLKDGLFLAGLGALGLLCAVALVALGLCLCPGSIFLLHLLLLLYAVDNAFPAARRRRGIAVIARAVSRRCCL